jgi:hypothetical protein
MLQDLKYEIELAYAKSQKVVGLIPDVIGVFN